MGRDSLSIVIDMWQKESFDTILVGHEVASESGVRHLNGRDKFIKFLADWSME